MRVLPYQLIPLTVPLCQILFENRKVGDVGNNCLLSVDGTDLRAAKSYEKPYYSYKFKKLGFLSKWPCASRPATFAGGQGHIYPAFGTTI